MSDMGNIKVKHLGGDRARMPSTAPGGHSMQRPGDAEGTPASKMSWKGQGMNASKAERPLHAKK